MDKIIVYVTQYGTTKRYADEISERNAIIDVDSSQFARKIIRVVGETGILDCGRI